MEFDWQLTASTIITISIIFSAISLGIGRALNIKRIELFGRQEIIESIINAAILGGAILISSSITSIGSEITYQYNISNCSANSPSEITSCILNNSINELNIMNQQILKLQSYLGYYQTLNINFGNFSIQPLKNINYISSIIANESLISNIALIMAYININFLRFISSNWFGVIFAFGLIFRSFFMTRKFGSFLIILSIAFIIIYPTIILTFENPNKEISEFTNEIKNFLETEYFKPIPIVDLNDNNMIGEKMTNLTMVNNNTTNQTTYLEYIHKICSMFAYITSKIVFYFIIVPIIAILITIVLIKDASDSFSTISLEVREI